ncbi:hypothetical protein SAMN05192534_10370 [Alteribacillus persepolensis]|uniref:Gas vesicle protein GvpU n=1 Tax=Alteribacillus persepolensis TaxID=568899 RepID=A0A1G8AYN9_9BACI|nr:gas vesicle accessory protein GvpU [Alteribacillus persepolensis]SDH25974.1 hypothetical protein SAMN05192534_10370 [Alteribacillus persepolensis]
MTEDVYAGKHSDHLLHYLVRLADNGAEIDITLNVSGTTIVGTLIGNVTYLDEVQRYLQTSHSDLKEKMTNFFEKTADKFQKHTDEDEYESGYIHLRDAKILEVHGEQAFTGNLWRGKLADVCGFSFGSIRVKHAESSRFE